MIHADAELDYWGNRFVEAGMAEVIGFADFMDLPPALREGRIRHMGMVRALRSNPHMAMTRARLRGARRIEPMHPPGPRRYRRAWPPARH